MTVLKQVPLDQGENPSIQLKNMHEWSPNEYDIEVQCWVSSTNVKVELWYRTESVSMEHAHNIASTFSKALDRIMDDPEQPVGKVNLTSSHHRQQIWNWNAGYPDVINRCLHDIISEQAAIQPQEIAIHFWEQQMTWEQLETYSDRLAHYLISLGVGPELNNILDAPAVVIKHRPLSYRDLNLMYSKLEHYLVAHLGVGPGSLVPLCFAKSEWPLVAMLAVLKAGGGYVLMDPTHSASRLQEIVNLTKSTFILCSPRHEDLSRSLAERAVVVSQKSVDACKDKSGPACDAVSCLLRNLHIRLDS